MPDKYFVLVQGLRGPEPQIWHTPQVNGEGKDKPTLWKQKLEGDQLKMNITQLGELFADEFTRVSSNS